MSSVEATKDADKGTWRKKFVTRLEKINLSCVDNFWNKIEGKKRNLREELENSVRNNAEIEVQKSRTIRYCSHRKTKAILNSLKWKPENVLIASYNSRGNSEYDKSNDSAVSDTEESDIEESDMEVIDAGQNSKEIDDLSQDETGIRNKLLKILVARQEKDTKSGKNFMTSIHLNGILDFSMM
ncbi:3147_t:CDS:2 [Rhizophagus irregularis]|nr:3147_t:CDS:2 [Rhizophagus irregularis]